MMPKPLIMQKNRGVGPLIGNQRVAIVAGLGCEGCAARAAPPGSPAATRPPGRRPPAGNLENRAPPTPVGVCRLTHT